MRADEPLAEGGEHLLRLRLSASLRSLGALLFGGDLELLAPLRPSAELE